MSEPQSYLYGNSAADPALQPDAGHGPDWHRLNSRMIWVDAVQSLLALTPTALAVWVFGVEPSMSDIWPAVGIAIVGVSGAIRDAMRWILTRYRVTDEHVERRSGLLLRSHRSVRRDRIRSVDATAKLRHRLAGLRLVEIGAGQQVSANESAFVLDAVSKDDAEDLRRRLLGEQPGAGRRDVVAPRVAGADEVPTGVETAASESTGERVLARLRPGWVVYNMFNIWAYVMAVGLLWGVYWLADLFGLDPGGFIEGLLDWDALGWGWTIALGVAVAGAIGVIGLSVNFFTENWGFELARVPGEKGTLLRTRQGLFRTREVNRDDNRLRGVEIAEPLLWRWMGTADTNVITTGLAVWSMRPSTTILPRGPVTVAHPVAAAVLDADPNPLAAPLERHPRSALRRRLLWATLITGGVVALLGWLAVTDVVPGWAWIAGLGLWPISLWAGWIAYRALGHAIVGEYLVTRSGLMSRSTAALQRGAVSTIALRESVLQRRLGVKTVSAMTAAGWGAYEAPDIAADDALSFATDAAPGLLGPLLEQG